MYLLIFFQRKLVGKCRPFLLISAILFLFVRNTTGQTYQLPAVVKPSPQSMAFTRYGDYPMAGCNGLTDITIPIHTISGRKLSVPITMSFHASGRMANETNGMLGMRWTLNCGGLVSRTMKGCPDEWSPLIPFDVDPYISSTVPPFDTLYSACTDGKIQGLISQDGSHEEPVPRYDSEFDIFNYSLPNGKQGHFIFKNQNGTKVPMTIPYEPLKIEFVKDATSNGYIQYLTITDIDGTQYMFGKINGSTANAIEWTNEPDIVNGELGNLPTAWYLSKIISADSTDQIAFSYTSQNQGYWYSKESANIGDRLRNANTYLDDTGGDTYEDNLIDQIVQWHFEPDWDVVSNYITKDFVPTITGITFDGGSTSFTYNTDQLLTQIVINRASIPYKKITFNCVKHTGEPDLYYLDDIKFYGEDQSTVGEKYAFTYYDGVSMDTLQQACKYKDWWGYANSPNSASHLLPYQSVPGTKIPSGPGFTQDIGFDGLVNRNPDDGRKKIGMLKTITYPTSGQTEFVYEQNKYDWTPYYVAGQNTYTLDGPGLRIKEIISTPVLGKQVHRMFKYGIYEDGRGYIQECLRPGSLSWQQVMVSEGTLCIFGDLLI